MNINGLSTLDLFTLTSQPDLGGGRRCNACLGPIAHEDDFGRSEGICRRCVRRKPDAVRSARTVLDRLRRAA
jgi:hypothetical protein